MNIDIEYINNYIKKSYQINSLINKNYRDDSQICFKNNNIEYPFCSFYFGICPDWGFAPGEMLIYYSKEKKDHTGSGAAMVYKDIKDIDYLMSNIFKIEKKQEQLTLF